jgi:hypothetical protein
LFWFDSASDERSDLAQVMTIDHPEAPGVTSLTIADDPKGLKKRAA